MTPSSIWSFSNKIGTNLVLVLTKLDRTWITSNKLLLDTNILFLVAVQSFIHGLFSSKLYFEKLIICFCYFVFSFTLCVTLEISFDIFWWLIICRCNEKDIFFFINLFFFSKIFSSNYLNLDFQPSVLSLCKMLVLSP